MPRIIEINDESDPVLACYANLRSLKRASDETFVVEGRLCVQRLVESRHQVISAVVERGKVADVARWLSAETPLYSLSSEQVRRLVGFDFHRGMLACGRRPKLRSPDELEFKPGAPAISVAAVGVVEPENLGSLIRTASALGIDQVLIGPKTADPFSRRAIRVSMAAVLKQNLYELDRPAAQLSDLQRSRNCRTIVATLDSDATPLSHFVADDRPSILVIGNEAEGVDQAIQDVATDRVTIPMRLGVDSLNVSVAAAIFMYELLGRYRN